MKEGTMKISLAHMKTSQKATSKKGGFRTMPFIISNETFEKVASIGLHANMMLYLRNVYHFDVAAGATILLLWGAASNFTPILGAFFADSFLGRFRVIALGTIITLLGMVVLLLTAIFPQARPPYCEHYPSNCVHAQQGQRLLLFSSFALMSIGAGGVRPCSLAFGADQLDKAENPNNDRLLQSFFNWYYASVGVSVMISVTVIVYIQDKDGWIVGFAVPVGLMLLSALFFFMGSSIYVKIKANKNLFAGFAHVVSAAWKNRDLSLPAKNFDSWYCLKGSKLVKPTDKLRFLNKACIIKSPEDLTPEGLAIDPWSLNTVKEVEEFKALIKVLPLWSTGIFIAVTMTQHSFSVLQAGTMDRHFITPHFQIPQGSFVVFSILTMTIWIAIYDRLLVPIISKYTKRPRGLSFKQRMGIGLVISCLATAVSAIVEKKRRNIAIQEGLENNILGVASISATWLVPQYCLSGLAEAFNAIGQIEFYYSQFPKSMSSIGVSLFALGMCFGNLVGAIIVKIVKNVTTREIDQVSWLDDNFNKGHLDYYYWVLTFMGMVNFLYFIGCCRAYGPCDESNMWDVEEREGDLPISKEAMREEDGSKSKESSSIVFAA